MKKIRVPKKIHKFTSRRKNDQLKDEIAGLPRITNETVAEHREEVLSTARKYIYPLQHSRHRIVIISVTIFIAVVMAFFTYTLLALYRFNTTSGFMYRVTSVLPFPVARAGSNFVLYDDYLFELRRYMHYYETQQNVDFSNKEGQKLLAVFRKRALDSVIQDAYIKQLARQNKISVSRAEIDAQVALLKSQNRLGATNEVFEDVLQEFWGWSVDDFRRVLRQQILAQKVAIKLDTKARATAQSVLDMINAGGDFSELAKKYSQDPAAKETGGSYGEPIDRMNRDLQPQVIDALFKLDVGQTSGIIEAPDGFEIVKVFEKNPDGKVKASHILVIVTPPVEFAKSMQDKNRTWRFIST
jgi:PPIC-type PPIASE domain/SurA N-terminal domain